MKPGMSNAKRRHRRRSRARRKYIRWRLQRAELYVNAECPNGTKFERWVVRRSHLALDGFDATRESMLSNVGVLGRAAAKTLNSIGECVAKALARFAEQSGLIPPHEGGHDLHDDSKRVS